MNRLTLALDVMGGDIGPRITIPASLSALEADPMLSLVLFADDPKAQTRHVLETIRKVIETAGGTMADVTFNRDRKSTRLNSSH